MDIEKLKYPIGKPSFQTEYDQKDVTTWIETINDFPSQISTALEGVSEAQLKWKYRPEGWNIKEVVHHCADSHSMALLRFKKALTEDLPDIMGYNEYEFSLLNDYDLDLDASIYMLKGLHIRWTYLLRGIEIEDLERAYFHKEMNNEWKLSKVLQLYAWHCNHHLAHVHQAIESEGSY